LPVRRGKGEQTQDAQKRHARGDGDALVCLWLTSQRKRMVLKKGRAGSQLGESQMRECASE